MLLISDLITEPLIQANMTLKQFVKDRRKALGLTQKDTALKAGVGLRFIRELERGKETLQMNKVNQILNLFGFELGAIKQAKDAAS